MGGGHAGIYRAMIEPAHKADLPTIADLCLRSKAHWGYDAAFLEACRGELTPGPEALGPGFVVWRAGGIEAMAQVTAEGETAELEALFVAPAAIGKGLGRVLFHWALQFAVKLGARSMSVTSDPFAAPFYERMGARRTGAVPSGSIVGRMLPRYEIPVPLCTK